MKSGRQQFIERALAKRASRLVGHLQVDHHALLPRDHELDRLHADLHQGRPHPVLPWRS